MYLQIWKTLRDHSHTIEGKGQLIMQAFAKVRVFPFLLIMCFVPTWCYQALSAISCAI